MNLTFPTNVFDTNELYKVWQCLIAFLGLEPTGSVYEKGTWEIINTISKGA